MISFPSLKAREILAILQRKPLNYKIVRQKGSHRRLEAEGREPILFAWHDRATVPPGAVRKMLIERTGLTEEEAFKLI